LEPTRLPAAIVGGGIAGLAAGLFAQSFGFEVPIFERTPALSCEENLLWIAPNGLRLLETLGLLSDLKAMGRPQDAMVFASKGLRPLMSLRGDDLEKVSGFPILAVRRTDLYRLMRSAFLRRGGRLQEGFSITGLQRDEGGFALSVANASKPLRVGTLFVADGIGSRLRRDLFPQSRVHYQGLCTYLGRSETPAASRFVGQTFETWGLGTRFVLTSLDGKSVYFSAIERPTTYLKNSDPVGPDLLPRLRDLFRDYHPDVVATLEGAIPESIHRCNFGIVTGLDRYAVPGAFLLGDAAHGMPPNMGQGASLALEDAYVALEGYARGLSKNALARHYDHERRARSETMQRMATFMNTAFQPKGYVASKLRDAFAMLSPDALSLRQAKGLYALPFELPRTFPNPTPSALPS
jgi:2-polyprenyl-6-methoxyphenol hydroxylase-like FAD-dependent oxidoreductase